MLVKIKSRIYAAPAVKGLNKYEYFCHFEVVGRGREAHLQVGENLSKLT